MKKLFTLTVVILLTSGVFAQAPQKMSYQCVVRNASGVLITNQSVGIRTSIIQGTPSGTVVYQETYSPNPQTNANGLVTVEIGGGFPITGTFSGISWSSGPYFLKTETDPTGGTTYTITGTSQLLSVPYALHAKSAATANYNDLSNLPTLNISNWNTAYGWGNHAGLYRPVGWVPAWTDVTGKPTFATVATSGSYNDLLNKPTILNSQWTTNGSNIYYNTGNVGIGTISPTKALEVSFASSNSLLVKSTAGFSTIDIDAFNGDANLRFYKAGSFLWDIRNNPSTDDLDFYEGGVGIRMTIENATGNVGIGTSSPTEKLTVVGNISAADYYYSTVKTKYLQIAGGSGNHETVVGGTYNFQPFYGDLSDGTTTSAVDYNVDLPDGAVIKGMQIYLASGTGTTTCVLNYGTNNYGTTIATLTDATPGWHLSSEIAINHTVNNASHGYIVKCSNPSPGDNVIGCIRIRYEVANP